MRDFGPAFGIADAVLYEGYLLFPYTASTGKNRVRWQFGVVVPEAYLAAETGEHAEMQTEILFEHGGAPDVDVLLRFLQVEARTVEVARDIGFERVERFEFQGAMFLTFDEAVEREHLASAPCGGILRESIALEVPGGRDVELLRDADGIVRARIVRERRPLRFVLELAVDPVDCERPNVSRLRVRVVNRSALEAGDRSVALRTSLVSTHAILAIGGGAFLSVLDPPAYAAAATASLANRQTFPVLIGDGAADAQRAALALSSPIILYDFPALGAQTDADAFDATEIDELLTLSVLSLSDRERAEARATDPRARAIVERAERFGPEAIARLHAGALYRGGARLADPSAGLAPAPDDPLLALDAPALDCVFVNGEKVTRGCSVRLHPSGRADVWDAMLDGKTATVRAIHQDLEDRTYVAVTVDDDPASDLHDWYGRAFFFSPQEVEPLATGNPS